MGMYLEISDIPGKAQTPGYEGQIVIDAVSFNCHVSTDERSGLLSGHRKPSLLHFVSPAGSHGVLLWDKMSKNVVMGTVILKFDGSPGGGQHELTVKLTNAYCRSVDWGLAGEGGLRSSSVSFALAYQAIEIVYEDGGIQTQMDWLPAV